MRSYRMTLAYDGTAYAGWQIQPDAITVQQVLEAALQRIVGSHVRVVASGRTDAGVHARGQVVSFRCQSRLEPEVLRRALEANTPEDICVREVALARDGFHAIRDALSKRYRYMIQHGCARDLFARRYCWYIPQSLDVPVMQRATACLIGRHDFASFEAAGAPRKTSVRTVHELSVARLDMEQAEAVAIEIEADGFLYNMVRNIVGSLVQVGLGKQPETWLAGVLAAGDRSRAGPTAPAQGLTLQFVRYAD